MDEKLKKLGGYVSTAIVMIILAFCVSECQKCSKEQDEKNRQNAAQAAIEDAAWEKEKFREFTVKPGEQATVYAGYRLFEFYHDQPIKAAAMVGSVRRTGWETFIPEKDSFLAYPKDCEKVVFWNDSPIDVTVQFILLSRKPK